MRYLISIENEKPFLTNWFDAENNFIHDKGMIVYDLFEKMYTTDGSVWKSIKTDEL